MPDSYEIVKFLASFALLFIGLYAIYYYVRNYGSRLNLGGKDIQILETRMVGKNRYLILAKIKQSIFLLSSDESGIKILKEWKEGE